MSPRDRTDLRLGTLVAGVLLVVACAQARDVEQPGPSTYERVGGEDNPCQCSLRIEPER